VGARILAVALAAPRAFEAMLAELRRRYPGATLVALTGQADRAGRRGDGAADEYLTWRSLGLRELSADLARRRFDLVIVAHGRDYYATRVYWKGLALALLSRAPGKLFCEDATLPATLVPLARLTTPGAGVAALVRAAAVGAAKTAVRAGVEVYVGGAGLLLLPLLAGIALVDGTEALARVLRRPAGPTASGAKHRDIGEGRTQRRSARLPANGEQGAQDEAAEGEGRTG
jgi:hypothetical protein